MIISKLRSLLKHIVKQPDEATTNNQNTIKRFKRCVLHIGTEKTGTSTIQRFLAVNRSTLLHDGVIYPSTTGKNGGSQWGFVACAQNKPWTSDVGKELGIHSASDQEAYKHKFRANLWQEFEAAPKADVLVISSEHLHSRLSSIETITCLKEFLEPWVEQFEIVLYLRRQDYVAISHYSTKIKSGNPCPLPFLNISNEAIPYYFDYNRIYDNWCTVFGKKALQVRLFSPQEWKQGNLVYDFCAACGLHAGGKRMPVIANVSLNQTGVDFLLEVNRQLPRVVDGKNNKKRDAIAHLVSKLCQGKNQPASREEAIAFYHHFLESNRQLKEKAFPERSEPLFDNDFSSYPEEVKSIKPCYEDAVKLAIHLWKAKP